MKREERYFLERSLEGIGAIGGYRKKLEGLKGGAAPKKNTPLVVCKKYPHGNKKISCGDIKF